MNIRSDVLNKIGGGDLALARGRGRHEVSRVPPQKSFAVCAGLQALVAQVP
jgi:hypothetical protein